MLRLALVAVVIGIGGCAHHPPVALDPHCTAAARTPAGHELAPLGALYPKTVADVTIAGTDADPGLADTLRRQLATKPGTTLSNDVVREDLRRLWALGVLSDVQVDVHSAGHDVVAVTFAVTPQPLIDRVYITDPSVLELRRLRWLAGTPYEPVRIARMAKAIQDTLLYDGYLDASVVVKRAAGEGVGLCVIADRGPRVTIDRVVFPGRSAIPYAKLVEQLRGEKAGINRPGGIFDIVLAEEDRDRMLALYYELGRVNTSIDQPRITRHGDHVTVEIPIRESPIFHIGEIHIQNVRGKHVPLGIARGEVFVRSRVVAAIERLHAVFGADTDIFPDTKVDLPSRRIDLDFHIQWSRPWHALRLLPSR